MVTGEGSTEGVRRGSGGGAPPQVHTPGDLRFRTGRGTPPPTGGPAPRSGGGGARQQARAAQRAALKAAGVRRSRLARGSRRGWREWVEGVASALEELGAHDQGQSLRQCGRLARVSGCGSCGEPAAHVEVHATCDVRVCPWCARLGARERVEHLGRAAELVPGLATTRAREVDGELVEAVEAATASRDRWRGIAERHREAAGYARTPSSCAERLRLAEGAEKRAAAAEERRRLARFELSRVREWKSWRWRLVTISPKWTPGDPQALTVAGLRRRVDDVLRRWRECWDAGARAGGAAAAWVRVELSDAGHVHCHALVYGPWLRVEWWAARAGCFVDVRAPRDVSSRAEELPRRGGVVVDDLAPGELDAAERAGLRSALRECLKYALKTPSPAHGAWMAGARRDVAHPELAARWVVATRHVQLVRHYGVAREAAGLVPDPEPRDDRPELRACWKCGCCDLHPGELVPTRDVAEYLGERWKMWRTITPRAGPS